MRIQSLNLTRYGCFTDRTINFNPSARLHLVHGKNAAGKSCALAGITDLLFGIEAQSRFSFIHEPKNMRLGAALLKLDGTKIDFVRRKGNKNVLTTTNGAPLPDSALQPFLGNLNRNVFTHAFGLNSQQLRAGAEEMLRSDGEVGVSLYAAASGLSGITRLRAELEDEASKIFKPGRSSDKRLFDKASEAFTQARQEMKNKILRVEILEGMRKDLERLTSHLGELTKQRAEARTEHARLVRLKTIVPQLNILDSHISALSQFVDLPECSAQSIARLREAIGASESAGQQLRAAQEALDRSREAAKAPGGDSDTLAYQTSVDSLQTKIGKYESATADRARVAAEADFKQRELNQLSVRLGIAPADLTASQPSDSVLSDVESLIAEKAEIERKTGHYEEAIRELEEQLEQLRAQATESPEDDPALWRDQFYALRSGRVNVEKLIAITANIATARRKLSERAARLAPPIHDMESHASLSLPSIDTIERHRREILALEDSKRLLAIEFAELTSQIEEGDKRLAALQQGPPVASNALIESAREGREVTWGELRSVVLGDTPSMPDAGKPYAVELFEKQSSEADRLADAAIQDADRVAEFNSQSRTVSELKGRLKTISASRELNEKQLSERVEDWLQLWMNVTDSPANPGEMAAWIESSRSLLEQRDAIIASESERLLLEDSESKTRAALIELGTAIGLATPNNLETLSIFDLLDSKIKRLEKLWADNAANQGIIADKNKSLAQTMKKLIVAKDLEADWETGWAQAISPLNFSKGASTASVGVAAKAWLQVPSLIVSRDNDLKRVRGMDRDIAEFTSEVTRLSGFLLPDEVELEPVDQATRLKRTMDSRIAEKLLFDDAIVKFENDQQNFEDAERFSGSTSLAVKAKMTEMSLSGEPSTTLDRLERAFSTQEQVAAARKLLVEQSDGIPEERLRAELTDFDAAEANRKIQTLSDGFSLLDDEINTVYSAKLSTQNALDDAELSSGGEIAHLQMKSAETEMAVAIREYVKLRLSANLLDKVIEEHRTGQTAPLMSRAGELFSKLTGGHYSRLMQEFDPENDMPELVGERPDGRTVCIDGMSEGQRDQLYLALRLAYLEDYAAANEAIPFIGDDIFTTFDEDSTRAGLLALSDIGEHLQPILFTHHEFVVNLAEETLGSQVDVLRI